MMSILQLRLLQVLTSCCFALDQVNLNQAVLALSKQVKNKGTEEMELMCKGKLFEQLFDTVARVDTRQIQSRMKMVDPLVVNQVHFSYKELRQEHSIVLVILPRDSHFQLHNHPNMIVLTKPLFGSLEIDTMDLEKTNKPHQKCNKQSQKCCCQSQDKIFSVVNWERRTLSPQDVSVTTPKLKNIHRIKALTDSIFMDILIPDYKNGGPEEYEYLPDGQAGKRIRVVKESQEHNRFIEVKLNSSFKI